MLRLTTEGTMHAKKRPSSAVAAANADDRSTKPRTRSAVAGAIVKREEIVEDGMLFRMGSDRDALVVYAPHLKCDTAGVCVEASSGVPHTCVRQTRRIGAVVVTRSPGTSDRHWRVEHDKGHSTTLVPRAPDAESVPSYADHPATEAQRAAAKLKREAARSYPAVSYEDDTQRVVSRMRVTAFDRRLTCFDCVVTGNDNIIEGTGNVIAGSGNIVMGAYNYVSGDHCRVGGFCNIADCTDSVVRSATRREPDEETSVVQAQVNSVSLYRDMASRHMGRAIMLEELCTKAKQERDTFRALAEANQRPAPAGATFGVCIVCQTNCVNQAFQ